MEDNISDSDISENSIDITNNGSLNITFSIDNSFVLNEIDLDNLSKTAPSSFFNFDSKGNFKDPRKREKTYKLVTKKSELEKYNLYKYDEKNSDSDSDSFSEIMLFKN